MQEIYIQTAIIGVLLLLVIIEAFQIRKARSRITELEMALGPEKLFSIDETKSQSRMHKEIFDSLEWLRSLRQQIPKMSKATLKVIKDELTDTHEMYCEAFGKDLIEKGSDQSVVQLKQALLLQIEIAISSVEREIAAKSS